MYISRTIDIIEHENSGTVRDDDEGEAAKHAVEGSGGTATGRRTSRKVHNCLWSFRLVFLPIMGKDERPISHGRKNHSNGFNILVQIWFRRSRDT